LQGNVPAAEVVLAFDYGTRRIGVAAGQTLTRSANAAGIVPARDGVPDWDALKACLARWAPSRLLVGLPYNMDGSDTTTTAACRRFGAELQQHSGLPVEFVDERLTSAAAYDELRNERRSGSRSRRIRSEDIDANAARLILLSWMRRK
jgi:putative Holliday junction resolvase